MKMACPTSHTLARDNLPHDGTFDNFSDFPGIIRAIAL